MIPVLFKLGPITIHSYGFMLFLAIVAGILLARRRAARFGMEPDNIYDLSFWMIVLGILGARLLFIVQAWEDYRNNLGAIFSQFSGLTSFGGLLGGVAGVAVYAWRAKKRLGPVLDTIAPSLLLGHAIGRIGCLLNGCCYGHACDLPWGVEVKGMAGLYHPAQVYDSLMNLCALGLLLLIERRGLRHGQVFGWMLLLHGITRVVYELWRAGTSSTTISGMPITEAQVAAAFISLVGVIIIFTARKQLPSVEPT